MAENKKQTIKTAYDRLEGKIKGMHEKHRKFAEWTLPYTYPQSDFLQSTDRDEGAVRSRMLDPTGATGVNNLANRVVNTLFPVGTPFFSARLPQAIQLQLSEVASQDDNAQQFLIELERNLTAIAVDATQRLEAKQWRSRAVETVKLLIITGNALNMFDERTGDTTVFSTMNYVVHRDPRGNVQTLITRETLAYGSIKDPEIKAGFDKYMADRFGRKSDPDPDKEYTLYTKSTRMGDGRFQITKGIENWDIPDDNPKVYSEADWPYNVLTWTLASGDHYGRGLIEDYAGGFQDLQNTTNAFAGIVNIASDVLVRLSPNSVLQTDDLIEAESGDVIPAEDGDIGYVQPEVPTAVQIIPPHIEQIRRDLGQGLLLGSATIRDAERVTAEEIRRVAQELEHAFGGVYSKLAYEWQLPIAEKLMKAYDLSSISDQISEVFDTEREDFEPDIITGVSTLARASDMDRMRVAAEDIAYITNLPEAYQEFYNPRNLIDFVYTSRGVDASKFLRTDQDVEQKRSEQQEQVQQAQAQEASTQAAAQAAGNIAQDITR